jgi:hypothetical protein
MASLGAALFAYAGYGIKPSDNSGAGERRLTGFPCSLRSAGGRPFGDGANFVDEAKRPLKSRNRKMRAIRVPFAASAQFGVFPMERFASLRLIGGSRPWQGVQV